MTVGWQKIEARSSRASVLGILMASLNMRALNLRGVILIERSRRIREAITLRLLCARPSGQDPSQRLLLGSPPDYHHPSRNPSFLLVLVLLRPPLFTSDPDAKLEFEASLPSYHPRTGQAT